MDSYGVAMRAYSCPGIPIFFVAVESALGAICPVAIGRKSNLYERGLLGGMGRR